MYVIVISRTSLRVDLLSMVARTSRNSKIEAVVIYEVYVTATGFEFPITYLLNKYSII